MDMTSQPVLITYFKDPNQIPCFKSNFIVLHDKNWTMKPLQAHGPTMPQQMMHLTLETCVMIGSTSVTQGFINWGFLIVGNSAGFIFQFKKGFPKIASTFRRKKKRANWL